jgi:hypothetical protein
MPAAQRLFQRTVAYFILAFGGCDELDFERFHPHHSRNPDWSSSSQDHRFVLRSCFGRMSLPGNLRLGSERRVFLTDRHGARTLLDFAFSVEAAPMATNEPISLFRSDHAEEPEQRRIGKAWDRAVISSRILNTSILVVTAAAIVFAILSMGNPLVLFANGTASLIATSAPHDGTGQSMPIMQSTTGALALPPTASEAPTRYEIASAFKTAEQVQAEIRRPPVEALLNQFQAWAAEEDAQAQDRPIQPLQDVQARPVQDTQAHVVQKQRQVRPVQNARRAEARPVQNGRAKVRREQHARAQVRP